VTRQAALEAHTQWRMREEHSRIYTAILPNMRTGGNRNGKAGLGALLALRAQHVEAQCLSYSPRQSFMRTWRISRNMRMESPTGLTRLLVM
jgi:transposase InsO family protein